MQIVREALPEELLSMRSLPHRGPHAFLVRLLMHPLDIRFLLGVLVCISFVPLNFDNVYQPNTRDYQYVSSIHHSVVIKVGQNLTQGILCLLCLGYGLLNRTSFRIGMRAAIVLTVFVALFQICAVASNNSPRPNYSGAIWLALFLFVGVSILSVARKMTIRLQGRLIATIISFVLAFFCVECVGRFLLSPYLMNRMSLASWGFASTDDSWLYRYKASLFYLDSNVTGIALICLGALMFAFHREIRPWQFLLFYVLVLGTLSRASIVAASCQFLIFKLWRHRRAAAAVLLSCGALLTAALFAYYLAHGSQSLQSIDESFQSKFLILNTVVSYLNSGWLQKVIGIGTGNSGAVIGIAAHSIIATAILEYGIVGSVLIAAIFWLMARKSASAIYLLLIPIVINGFSLFSDSAPCFYVVLGILGAIEESR